MKLISAGAGLLFLVLFGFPLLFLAFGIAWAIVGWWAIPVTVFMLGFIGMAAYGNYIEQQNGHSQ